MPTEVYPFPSEPSRHARVGWRDAPVVHPRRVRGEDYTTGRSDVRVLVCFLPSSHPSLV